MSVQVSVTGRLRASVSGTLQVSVRIDKLILCYYLYDRHGRVCDGHRAELLLHGDEH